jgi:hypothetical protein
VFRFPRALSILVALLAPAVALAQPFPGTSVVPAFIRIVTPRAGGVDPTAVYTVVVNDFFGFPIPGETVTLDFTGCPHVDPASEQSFPGMSVVSCDPTVLSALTNALGEASFLVQGSVVSRGAAGTGLGCVLVSAGAPPIPLGATSPAAYDQDGVNGLTANDLSLWLCDFVALPLNVRSDFNGDAALTPLDLLDWFQQYVDARGTSRTPLRCDGAPAELAANPVPAPRLRLAWNQCAPNGGAQTRTFACNTNSGPIETLEGTFIAPPGVDAMTGFEAEVAMIGDDMAPMPDWWRVDPAGCRPTALAVNVDYEDLIGGCPNVAQDIAPLWVGIAREEYPIPATSTRGLIRIIGAFNPPGLALTAGQEYSIFRLRVTHTRTVGTGSCAGCGTPIAFLFRGLKLTQSATAAGGCLSPAVAGPGIQAFTGDFVIPPNTASDEWVAFWQGVPAAFPTVLSAPPASAEPIALAIWSANPSRGATPIRLSLPRPLRCALALYDVSGRRLRSLLEESLPAGTRSLTWDGRDDQGRLLASGYYVLRLTTEDGAISRPIIRLE